MSPNELTAHFLTQQTTHNFAQYNPQRRLKRPRLDRYVRIDFEDREIIARSNRSNERRQAPRASVGFKEETTCRAVSTASSHLARKATMKILASECFLSIGSGDLRNEGQKTQAERLDL